MYTFDKESRKVIARAGIPSLTVKIPKDSGEVVVPITITKATLDPSKQYALGLKITNVSEGVISATGGYFVVKFLVKNKYDGLYRVTGTMVDLTSASLTGNYPLEFELRSTGANTSAVFDHGTGTQTHLILSGGAPSQYGSFGLNLTFDLLTNKITSVVNSYGQPASNGRSAGLDPTGINAYDPATKTIRIKYFFSFFALIDLFSILPFYLTLVFPFDLRFFLISHFLSTNVLLTSGFIILVLFKFPAFIFV